MTVSGSGILYDEAFELKVDRQGEDIAGMVEGWGDSNPNPRGRGNIL